MSRETVAWVTSKPCAVSASTTSRWLPTGRDVMSSRMARWRRRLSSWRGAGVGGGHHARAHTRLAGGRDARPEGGIGQGAFEGVGGGPVCDDRLGARPAERAERGADLGHHAARDDAGLDEVIRLARRSASRASGRRRRARRRRRSAGRAGAPRGPAAMPGRDVIGVHVAHDPVGIPGERARRPGPGHRPGSRRAGRAEVRRRSPPGRASGSARR